MSASPVSERHCRPHHRGDSRSRQACRHPGPGRPRSQRHPQQQRLQTLGRAGQTQPGIRKLSARLQRGPWHPHRHSCHTLEWRCRPPRKAGPPALRIRQYPGLLEGRWLL